MSPWPLLLNPSNTWNDTNSNEYLTFNSYAPATNSRNPKFQHDAENLTEGKYVLINNSISSRTFHERYLEENKSLKQEQNHITQILKHDLPRYIHETALTIWEKSSSLYASFVGRELTGIETIRKTVGQTIIGRQFTAVGTQFSAAGRQVCKSFN